MRRFVLAGVLVAVASCGGRHVNVGDGSAGDDESSSGGDSGTSSPGDGPDDGPDDGDDGWVLDVGAQPPPPPAEIDILFVVDNSFSMRHEARNVAQNMLGIWNELEDLTDPEGQPFLDFFDVHMMVTTTDVGGPHCAPVPGYQAMGGSPLTTGCNARADEFVQGEVDLFDACTSVCPEDVLPDGDFIHLDPDAGSNVPGDDIGTALACLGTQGIVGCEYSQPLEAMYRALDPGAPWNIGDDPFLRERSLAVVVLISDAPDCSVADPAIFEDESLMNANPVSAQPEESPAVCWNSGVECVESDIQGVYDSCESTGQGLLGVDRYIERLQEDLAHEHGRDVVMVAALGVPEVHEHNPNPPFQPTAGGIFDLVYRDWTDGTWPFGDVLPGEDTTGAEEQWFNGIGPGCTGEDGMGGFVGQAMPPVRAAEVCQALDGEGDAEVGCCIESICDPDFAHMMRCIVGVQQCFWDSSDGGQGERCIPPG